jgi:AsmA family
MPAETLLRDLITGLAVLLLLALAAAFAGPHFIDWDQRRAEINRQLSAALGREARVEGPVGLTLLPTPFLKLGHVTLAGARPLTGTIGRVRATASAPALLRGELRLTSVEIDGAQLSLRSGTGEETGAQASSAISIQKLSIRDSALTLIGADNTPLAAINAVSGDLDAVALDGPWRGALTFSHDGAARTLRFSTGKASGGMVRLRALLEDEAVAMRADYDGTAGLRDGWLTLDGRLSASGNLEIALAGEARNQLWRAHGTIKGNARQALVEDMEIAIGPSERQAVVVGGAEVGLSDGRISATLAARQIDLDRLLIGDGGTRPPSPEALVRDIAGQLGRGGAGHAGRLSGTLDLTVGSVILGGGVIAGPRLTATIDGGHLTAGGFSGELPGRTLASLRIAGPQGGPLSVEVADVPALAGWFRQDPSIRAPIRRLSISGTAVADGGGIRLDDANIRADDMRFGGTASLAMGGARPRITLNLAADRLDVAKLPEPAGGGNQPTFDLELELDAKRVSYNGVGAGAVKASLSRTGAGLDIRDITVSDLGGAALKASGSPERGFAAELRGERLEALMELLERLLPHPALPLLKARAAALAPAELAITAAPAAGDAWRLAVRGSLGGSSIDGEAHVAAGGGLSPSGGAHLKVRSEQAAALLRQIGLPTIPVASAGPAELTLTGEALAEGRSAAPWTLRGTVGGLAIDLAGARRSDPAEPFAGRLSLSAADAFPLAQSLLVAAPRVPPGTGFSLTGGIDLRGYKITFRDMDMKIAGVPVAGEIAFNLAEFGRVQGQLKAAYFDFGLLAPLVFGEPQTLAGQGWSSAAFQPPAPAALPGDLWIEAGEARIADGLTAREAGFVIRFDNGLLFLEHARGKISGMDAEAHGTLRRTGRSVALAGRASLVGNPVLAGQPATTGARIDTSLDVTALGDSPAQLVAALSGTGAVRHSGLKLPALNADAFSSIAGQRGGLPRRSDVAAALRGALDQRSAAPPAELRLTLGGGVLRTQPQALESGGHQASATASFDLRQLQFTGRMAFAARHPPKDWSGPPPQAAFVWRGLPGALSLEVEADELANGVTALAIRRESDRIEALEQDQRERSFFNRRLRAAEEERRATEEARQRELLARVRAERERQERERQERERVQREQAERERRRAEDAARAAPPSLPPPIQILPNAVR